MKKLTAILLALMLLVTLAACGNDKNPTNTDGEATSASSDAANTEETSEETTEETTTEKAEFEEVTLINDEYMTLIITDAYNDKEEGYTMKAVIENVSRSEDYCYTLEQCSVNGISVDSFFYTEVKAGKKALEGINIYDELLSKNGITEYTDIEMVFTVQKDILGDTIATKTVHFYPQGEDKAVKYERQSKDTDAVLIDNEYITLTATGMEHDSEWECQSIYFYIENKSDEDIILSAESASVNDFMLDTLYGDTIPAGKSKFSSAEWMDYELEEKGISAIEEIEIEFKGYSEPDTDDILESIDDLLSGDESDDALFEKTVVYRP